MTWPGAGWRNRRAWGGEQLITSALCGNQVEGGCAAEQNQLHLRVLATQVITLCQQTPGACVVSKPPAHQPNHCTAPISAESKLVSLFIFLGWSAVGLMRGRGWIQNSEGRSRLFQNVTKSKTWIWTDFDEEEKKTAQVDTGRVAKPQSRQMGIVITICKETVTTTSHQHHHSPNIKFTIILCQRSLLATTTVCLYMLMASTRKTQRASFRKTHFLMLMFCFHFFFSTRAHKGQKDDMDKKDKEWW